MKQKKMLSQDMTKKIKEAIPDSWNCLFCFEGCGKQIPSRYARRDSQNDKQVSFAPRAR
jgi:hypothetical protein